MDTIEKMRIVGKRILPQRHHQRAASVFRSLFLSSPLQTVTKTVGPSTAKFNITAKEEAELLLPLTEYETILDLLLNIKGDDCFWDVGANVGKYTCLAADVLPAGRVVAIEPHPKNTGALKENIQLNDQSVTVQECALGDTNGTIDLSNSEDRPGGNHSSHWGEHETVPVEMRVGDELVASGQLPHPTVLKIDIEGGEYSAIQGLEKTLSGDECRFLYCEVHPNPLPISENTLLETIEGYGFTIDRISNEMNYIIRASK